MIFDLSFIFTFTFNIFSIFSISRPPGLKMIGLPTRLIKNMKYKSIAISKIPNTGLGLAINDRLDKASYK